MALKPEWGLCQEALASARRGVRKDKGEKEAPRAARGPRRPGRRQASPEPAARDRVLQRRREKKPVHRIHHHGNQSSETKGRNTLGDGASRGAWPPARVRGEKR